jgi:hypothetical protein
MSNRFLGASTIATLALFVTSIRADDSVRLLGGSGSLTGAMTADLRTLEGGKGDAEALPVCYWKKLARWGYCAPVCPPVVYSAPVYYSAPAYIAPPIAPAPAAGPATYYAPAVSDAVVLGPRRQISVGYQGRFFSGTVDIPLGARLARFARPAEEPIEMAPPPRSGGNYRYDGGPSQSVPMPTPDPINATDPVPATVPALHQVMWERSRQKAYYPAYGERPAKRPSATPPLLVKRANG